MRTLLPHVAALAVISACIWLTLWQLDRAGEKREILQRWHAREPVELGMLSAPYDVPLPVETGVGNWVADRQLMIDNRVRQGRTGVHVLTPWRAPDGRLFLVDRGWASWPARTEPLPDPAPAGDSAALRGVLTSGPDVGLRLGDVELPDDPEWPLLVTYFDAEPLRALYGPSLQPTVIQLDPGHPAHLTGDRWQVVTFGPKRHLGYAMTWTSIAIVVGLIWLVLSIRGLKRREEGEP